MEVYSNIKMLYLKRNSFRRILNGTMDLIHIFHEEHAYHLNRLESIEEIIDSLKNEDASGKVREYIQMDNKYLYVKTAYEKAHLDLELYLNSQNMAPANIKKNLEFLRKERKLERLTKSLDEKLLDEYNEFCRIDADNLSLYEESISNLGLHIKTLKEEMNTLADSYPVVASVKEHIREMQNIKGESFHSLRKIAYHMQAHVIKMIKLFKAYSINPNADQNNYLGMFNLNENKTIILTYAEIIEQWNKCLSEIKSIEEINTKLAIPANDESTFLAVEHAKPVAYGANKTKPKDNVSKFSVHEEISFLLDELTQESKNNIVCAIVQYANSNKIQEGVDVV